MEPVKPETVASAIKIGNPVSWVKALGTIRETEGVVENVSDSEIMDAKAVVDAAGVGCEPASAASVAGAKKLHEAGMIDREEEVVCVLTGHLLKDPEATVSYHTGAMEALGPSFANPPKVVDADLRCIEEALSEPQRHR
jgi:threonine synthase